MLNIYLTRHGQDKDNERGILNGHRDQPLTKLGISQAEKLAENIQKQGINFQIIYTSPLKRTVRTAQIIAKSLDAKKPKPLAELIERDFGEMIFAAYYKIDWKRVLTQFHFGNSDLLILSDATKPENAHVFQNQQFNL
jgi:broad specificity phosphatase PhoE